MRRAQSVRHYGRPSLALGIDDLGVLKENNEESTEEALRRQLLEKDRENDKLQAQIQSLQAQLAQRPPLETVQVLEKEYTNLEILLQGTQRENERCMAELERCKAREKMLEKELEKLVGANWQNNLDIPSSSTFAARSGIASTLISPSRTTASAPSSATGSQSENTAPAHAEATRSHIEQVRLLILGMEQRLQTREEKLVKSIEKAEAESSKFEEMRKQMLSAAP